MSNKRKKIVISTSIVMSIAVIVVCFLKISPINAYMTDKDGAVNEIHIGNVDIEVKENFPNPGEIKSGDTITKEVSIGNVGKCDCYIRAYIVLSNGDLADYITLDYDTTNWVKGDDGYWYYKSIVPIGAETSKLIKNVTLSASTPDDKIDNLDIIVYSEAWQSEGFATYQDAWDFANHNK